MMYNNVIEPALLISVIALCILMLPIAIEDKISLLLNMLLIITVYQLLLVQNLPSSKVTTVVGRTIRYSFNLILLCTVFGFLFKCF